MICPKCSGQMRDGVAVCPFCGIRIKETGVPLPRHPGQGIVPPPPPSDPIPYRPDAPPGSPGAEPPVYAAGAPGEVSPPPPLPRIGLPDEITYLDQMPPGGFSRMGDIPGNVTERPVTPLQMPPGAMPPGTMPPPPEGGYQGYQPGLPPTLPPRGFDRDTFLLVSGVVYVAFTAMVAILVILFENMAGFGPTVVAVLTSLGVYAALAACGYTLIKRQTYEVFGTALVVAVAIAAVISLGNLVISSEGLAKVSGIAGGVALVGAHTALLLMMRGNGVWFQRSRWVAIGVTWVTFFIAMLLVFEVGGSSGTSYGYGASSGSLSGTVALLKVVVVFIVLDIAATIVSILMWRLSLRNAP